MAALGIMFGSYRSPALGTRAVAFIKRLGEDVGLNPHIISAAELDIPFLRDPYHSLSPKPEALEACRKLIFGCDRFVIVSGEYNHLPQPGLLNMMNFFYQEYTGKPAALVTYSVGEWGGIRAQAPLRTFASALGLIPMSSMLAIKTTTKTLSEAGEPLIDGLQKQGQTFMQTFQDHCDKVVS
ncbi:NADPH-dependent FMN reductase [Candidatus Hepatobacter penaei]|uniref:NADPH-dependent FMN reductase n=1 Tax=Candidatus Hepatobacter penaei TaxID=1274402 RepID=UPI0004F245C6|nr:NAD(P)H-dependent oxidoreductase [Candidatus Hepatobacter penaei]TGW15447.1 NADPH-dependent oxidoreductase [bacterium NHP-B]